MKGLGSVRCFQNAPEYDAVQWDGANQQQLADLVSVYNANGGEPTWTVDQAGTLRITFPYGTSYTLPAGAWLVSTPSWTGEFVGPYETVTAEVYAARFTARPAT